MNNGGINNRWTESRAAPAGHGGPPGRAGDPPERPYLERASAVRPTRSSGRRRGPAGREDERKTWRLFKPVTGSVRTVNRHFAPVSPLASSLHQPPARTLGRRPTLARHPADLLPARAGGKNPPPALRVSANEKRSSLD